MLNSHCFKGVYTYMVASANEHDMTLSQMVGFNRENRVRIMETLDDLRDLHEYMTCHHNELPEHFPISDEGFERQYTFKVSGGAQQIVDLIIEEPSLIRVLLTMHSEENHVQAILLQPGDLNDNKHRVGQTDAHGTFMSTIEPNEHPYHMKLVHTEFDMEDPCPVYDFHIAVKPLRYVVHENLQCVGYELPPDYINVTEKTTRLDVPGGFSDELLRELGQSNARGMVEYDIMIDLPHSDFFIDVELKSDFLSGNIRMFLFAADPDGNWHKIAHSELFDENSHDDIGIDADQELGLKLGDQTMIQRLRFVEEVDPAVVENASQLMLRLKVSPKAILDAISHNQLYNPNFESICFNFHMSVFIDEVDVHHMQDGTGNKLIRVDWRGKEQSFGHFDPSGRITAFLEYEKSMADHMPALKSTFHDQMYLQPLDEHGNENPHLPHVQPTHFNPKHDSDDVLIVSWSPYTLQAGVCYKLKFGHPQGLFFGGSPTDLAAMMSAHLEDSPEMHVCASGCNCDLLGTLDCIMDEHDEPVCICHPHFQGEDCSECADGFYRNHDGFCEKASLCADLGGQEDCAGHGTCIQEGPAAICQCDHGFANDGLDQCARCADPMMKWPYECHESRNWVTEQEDYECQMLQHTMPFRLFSHPEDVRHGGLH